jgi:Tol biopolymer transport system component
VQGGLTWSPDGSRIIFSAARGATIRYLPTSNLWSVARDDREWRQLTFGEASYADPDISPTGSIVANRWRGQSDIWRIPVDGSPLANVARASRVTRQTSQVFAPSVSPDGHHVAYVSDGGGHANLWVQTLATGESRQITYDEETDIQVGLPLWSPSGDRIAYFTARRDLFTYWSIEPDGSNRRPLAPDAAWAAWSPDGEWLYFTEQKSKLLKKIRPATGQVVIVRNDPATRPALSPDGRTMYYVTELQVWSGGSDYEVRAANPESGPSRLLASIPDRRMPRSYSWQPVLSPDGQWLLLALVDEPTTNLFQLSTTTGELRQLTDFQGRPTIIVRRASWAPDGQSVFAAIGERDADVVLIEGLRP